MKHNITDTFFRFSAYALLCCVAFFPVSGQSAWAQSKSRSKAISEVNVSVQIVDKDGSPIPSAEIIIAEGSIREIADAQGNVTFTANSTDRARVEAEGYIPVNSQVAALSDSRSITLYRPALYSEKLSLPYMEMQKRYSLGNTIVISGEELEKYSSTDLRNALTAIAPGVIVTENYGGVGVSALESSGSYGASVRTSVTSRGRTMMYMVDDVPVDFGETPLDPQQIESITIIRDVMERTLYGASGVNGIVYIKTKKGNANTRQINVSAEAGVNVADRMPEFVGGADYARLNNVARINSGLSPLYSESDINQYAQGDAYSLTHPNVDFKSLVLKNVMSYRKAGISSGGGNDVVRYFAYLGYAGEDDMYKIGSAADYNRVNINANLSVKLHKYITADFGIISSMGIRRSPHYGYSSTYAAEFPTVINDVNTIPAISFPVYANNDPELESPWYAVTSLYTQNPIGNILENGSYTETSSKGLMNLRLNVDLSFLTKGLKSMTYGAYDAINLVRLGIKEDYAAYILNQTVGENGEVVMTPIQSSSHSVVQTSDKSKILDYYSNRFYLVQKFSYDRTFGKHQVTAGADYMITKRASKNLSEHQREMNFGFNAGYVYDDKYIFQTALNEHGTYFLRNNRWAFSPTFGLGWIMSKENWLKDVKGIDFLKLRAQGGLLYYDSMSSVNIDLDQYSWDTSGSKFGPYSANQWFGQTVSDDVNRTVISILGNPNLRMQKRPEFSVGLDGLFLDKRLDVSLTYYNSVNDGQISVLSNVIPMIVGTSSGSFYMNYDKTALQGYEVSLGWKDKVGKDFSYAVNGWASGRFSERLRYDELSYSEPYRSAVGRSMTTIWGYRCIGQYQTDEEAAAVTQYFDTELKAGDLKYQDMNGDGVINSSDICAIGDSNPAMHYGISLYFKYRGLDLLLTGTGCSSCDLLMNNSYYWNGWETGNYSKYTLDHVNDASHPRLTYNKINNNYQTSSYWLRNGSYFKLQTLELGYDLPVGKLNIARAFRSLRVYLRGNNLFTLSGIKDLDPEALNSGLNNYPLMKTFVGGFKFTF